MDNFDSVALMSLPDEIEEFFTKEEFAEMSEYEKDRYKNIRVNYEMMIAVGKLHKRFFPLPSYLYILYTLWFDRARQYVHTSVCIGLSALPMFT